MTTTTSRAPAATGSIARRARIGTAGALLWTVSPVVWFVSDLDDQTYGSLAFVAVAVVWWICMVIAPLLLVAGHVALRASLGARAGRVGAVGIAIAATGLAAMALGLGIELASMTAGGGEVVAGYAIWMSGYLVSVVGALLTGIVLIRRRTEAAPRAAGWLLVLAVPLGIAIGLLGDLLVGENEAVFWAMLTVPTGVAWLLLGRALLAGRVTTD